MGDRWRICWQKKDGSGEVNRTLYFYTSEQMAKDDARRMNDLFSDMRYWVEQEPVRISSLRREK